MSFDEFKQHIIIYSKDNSYKLRNRYIERFINTKGDHYKKYIIEVKQYSDGICYTGYLWDCLINPTIIKFEDIKNNYNYLGNVLIFWDIHTKEKIWIEDYWKFGKDSVIEVAFNELIDNLNYLPEDIYICDGRLNWTIVLTHEDNNGIRICLKAGNI